MNGFEARTMLFLLLEKQHYESSAFFNEVLKWFYILYYTVYIFWMSAVDLNGVCIVLFTYLSNLSIQYELFELYLFSVSSYS